MPSRFWMLLLFAAVATFTGCQEEPAAPPAAPQAPNNPAPPPGADPAAPGGDPAAAGAAPAEKAPPTPKTATGTSKELLKYLPPVLKMAMGAKLATLESPLNPLAESVSAQLQPIFLAMARMGIEHDQIDQFWAGSDRETGEQLLCVRTKKKYDAAKIRETIGVTAEPEKVGRASMYQLPSPTGISNAVAFVDGQILLLGRHSTVMAALKNPEAGAARKGLDALDPGTAYFWLAGEESRFEEQLDKAGSAMGGFGGLPTPGSAAGSQSKTRGFAIGLRDTKSAAAAAATPPPGTDPAGGMPPPEAVPGSPPGATTIPGTTIHMSIAMSFEDEPLAAAAEMKLNADLEMVDRLLTIMKAAPQPGSIPGGGAAPPGGDPAMAGGPGLPGEGNPSPAANLSLPSLPTALPFNSIKELLQVRRKKENLELALNVPLSTAPRVLNSLNNVLRVIGTAAIGDGIFQGTLERLALGVTGGVLTNPEPVAGLQRIEGQPLQAGYSWMTSLLPHLGREDLYNKFQRDRSWTDPDNLPFARTVIPAFLNPLDPRTVREGLSQGGVGLTHFVGMSGVEDRRNVVAAALPRTDPRAGVFGYDSIAKLADIKDGSSQTIAIIGSGAVVGPWVSGGGATIRGAREPYFDSISGFGSRGLEKPGTYVMFADGSARSLSADIDPSVFKAMCTIGGAEEVDLSKVFPQEPAADGTPEKKPAP